MSEKDADETSDKCRKDQLRPLSVKHRRCNSFIYLKNVVRYVVKEGEKVGWVVVQVCVMDYLRGQEGFSHTLQYSFSSISHLK